jgi:hypothetical protein
VLFCVQVVQINNNEFNWREKKEITTFYYRQAKDMWVCQEIKKSNWQATQGAQTQCRLSH